MNSLPLTQLEAKHIVEDYRMFMWGGGTLDMAGLQHVLSGAAWDGLAARVDGVTEEHARRALDWFHDRWQRPPSAREAYQALDDVLTSPDAVKVTIEDTRRTLAALRARRPHDHQQLRAASEARKEAS